MTALVAASFQDGTAGAGSHARTKTVRFSPFALVGLIGTLHKILFSKYLGTLRGTPWRSLARYWGQSYLTGPGPPAGGFKWVYGGCPYGHNASSIGAVACG